jgi:hypothetical protein
MNRKMIMERWWNWYPGKPVWLQNLGGRLVCAFYDHEPGRAPHWCDWCGARIPDEQEGMDRQW